MSDKSLLLEQLRIDRSVTPVRRDRGRKLWWCIGGFVLLGVAVIVWLTTTSNSQALPVRIVVAQALSPRNAAASGSMVDASGYVVARRQATVSAKITGMVTEVMIEEGQHVEKYQIIARLDDSNARAALEQAKAQLGQSDANLTAARVSLENAKPIFQRNEKLLEQGWISPNAFDAAKSTYDLARTTLLVAEQAVQVSTAAVAVAQQNEEDTIVRAPFSGVVTVKAAQPGEIVSPLSAGGGFTRTGIGTIVDMESLEIEVDVSENFIGRIHPGQRAVAILNAYPDWRIPAAVIAVIPSGDRAKATVKVRIRLVEKDSRVLPETGAHVAFLDDATDTGTAPAYRAGVVVPVGAVQRLGDNHGVVFVVREGVLERHEVSLGPATSAGHTVLSGLSPGEQIAIGDFAKFAAGVRIREEQ
jgi:RND family efflux transporter MFP subunit